MVSAKRSTIAAAVAAIMVGAALPPARAQFEFAGAWHCSRCKREIGRGPNPPAQCPHCGAIISNNPENERVASTTGIVFVLVGVVIALVILGGALVVVLKRGKIGLMKSRAGKEADLPIVRGDQDPRSPGGAKPPTYEL